MEPVHPNPTIVVIGAGHVGKAVVHLANWLGFHVILNDDRAEFCSPDKTPGADKYINCKISDLPDKINIHPKTYFVLTTRNNTLDVAGLPALFSSSTNYIGVIGSKRRWELTKKSLQALGISSKKINQVHSPMGIEINAESPEQIALSILSQIISKDNKANDEE